MNLYAGLDVSLKETSVCIVDQDGTVLVECKALSEPEALAAALQPHAERLRRVGIEASALGGWLQVELSTRGFEAIVIETHHAHVSLSTMRNKTDRNDARGIAQLMRLGWYKAVHVKSAEAQRLRALLGCRKLLVRKLVDTENEIRGTLRSTSRSASAPPTMPRTPTSPSGCHSTSSTSRQTLIRSGLSLSKK